MKKFIFVRLFFLILFLVFIVTAEANENNGIKTEVGEIRNTVKITSVLTRHYPHNATSFHKDIPDLIAFTIIGQSKPYILGSYYFKEEGFYLFNKFLKQMESGKKTDFSCIKILYENIKVSFFENEDQEFFRKFGNNLSDVWIITGASDKLCGSEKKPKDMVFDLSVVSIPSEFRTGYPKGEKVTKISSKFFRSAAYQNRQFIFSLQGIPEFFAVKETVFSRPDDFEDFYENIRNPSEAVTCYSFSAAKYPFVTKYSFIYDMGGGYMDPADEDDWREVQKEFPGLKPLDEVWDISSVKKINCLK